MPEERKKIIISPLNWGFGHAGRMIPVARHLQQMGHEVIFGADKTLIPMIIPELPEIEVIEIPGVRMRYSRFFPQYLAVLIQVPKLVLASFKEHRLLKSIILTMKPDIVISDNRFGFFSRKVFCVYFTHMIRIPFPSPFRFLEFTGILLHRLIINRYNICLIPDLAGNENLSGRLSHAKNIHVNFVYAGLLSRFNSNIDVSQADHKYVCLILSGPEPQRTIFMKKVTTAAFRNNLRLVVLSGSELKCTHNDKNVTYAINESASVMQNYILNAGIVVCRSGYTSLMELISLSKGAIIVPTPGQTEQEYLGKYNDGRLGFTTVRQNELEDYSFTELNKTPPNRELFTGSIRHLDETLKKILQEEHKRTNH
jgi:predicted glycosyltransferase